MTSTTTPLALAIALVLALGVVTGTRPVAAADMTVVNVVTIPIDPSANV